MKGTKYSNTVYCRFRFVRYTKEISIANKIKSRINYFFNPKYSTKLASSLHSLRTYGGVCLGAQVTAKDNYIVTTVATKISQARLWILSVSTKGTSVGARCTGFGEGQIKRVLSVFCQEGNCVTREKTPVSAGQFSAPYLRRLKSASQCFSVMFFICCISSTIKYFHRIFMNAGWPLNSCL